MDERSYAIEDAVGTSEHLDIASMRRWWVAAGRPRCRIMDMSSGSKRILEGNAAIELLMGS